MTGDDPRLALRAETMCRNSEEASVLDLARELAAAAERGDVAEVVRLAGVIAACGEPDAMVG